MHEANEKLNETMRLPATASKTLFKDYVETWLKGKIKIQEPTKVAYRIILDNYLIPHFGNARISEIDKKDIQDFVHGKVEQNEVDPQRTNSLLDVLCQILTGAQVDGVIARHP